MHTQVADFRKCLIEIFLNTVSKYYNIENFIPDRCSIPNEIVVTDEKKKDKNEEPVKEIKNLPISSITTFVDLEGNVKISWINPNLNCTTKLTYSIPSKNISEKEIDLSNNTNENFSYTIPKSEAGKRIIGEDAEIEYSISITSSNLNFVFQSKTGKFQGDDHNFCPGLYVGVGKLEDKENTDYQYLWTDVSDSQVPELTTSNKGYIGFYIKQSRILKIVRKKSNITDIALVRITAKDGCSWELTAKDIDLPLGSGPRMVTNGGTLEVVQQKKQNGVETDVSDSEYGELYWKENGIEIPDSYKKESIEINTGNKAINSTTIVSAKAFNETKKVNIKVYELDKKSVSDKDLNFKISDYCDFINDINERLDFIKLGSPLSCLIQSSVYSYNAEKFNDPAVVRDQSGDYSGVKCTTIPGQSVQ